MHPPSTESCFVEATLSFKMSAGFHNLIYRLQPGQGASTLLRRSRIFVIILLNFPTNVLGSVQIFSNQWVLIRFKYTVLRMSPA